MADEVSISKLSILFSKAKSFLALYLIISGAVFSLFLLVLFLFGISTFNNSGVTSEDVINKSIEKITPKAPYIAKVMKEITQKTNEEWVFPDIGVDSWVSKGDAYFEMPLNKVEDKEVIIHISNTKDFLNALNTAKSGDVIQLDPGVYRIRQRSIYLKNAGTFLQPISVRGSLVDKVRIELDTLEGFYVDKPFWVFENLSIKGICSEDSQCEHAFHIVGKAVGTIIRNNEIFDFNAPIKANGVKRGGKYYYPDNGIIKNNAFYNRAVRKTGNPVTLLDMVAVNDWVVSDNLIADFMKEKSNRISYGAFFKGNGSGSIFERNLVICRLKLDVEDRVQVGLSFGGGATITSGCRNQRCDVEHTSGIIRHNVIMNCNDVAIYLNKAKDTEIYNNTIINTLGIDVRFPESSATVANNFITGRIKSRNGGFSRQSNNVVIDVGNLNEYFENPFKGDFSLKNQLEIIDQGVDLLKLEEDFCGRSRGPRFVDIGAFEFDKMNARCNPLRM